MSVPAKGVMEILDWFYSSVACRIASSTFG